VNEEKAAIERDAALAPVGEAWSTLVHQQAVLDRSIDRKVRTLLALRKELTSLKLAARPAGPNYDAEMDEINKILGIDIPSANPPVEEAETTKTEGTNQECP
jgi:hypothetical protein